MIRMNDIYYKIDSKLNINNFMLADTETKKEMIDSELKIYILEKITELNTKKISEKQQNKMNTLELFNVLAALIPEEQHFDTLRHFTHYILNIVSIMQGWQAIWISQERDTLIECPEIIFDEDGNLDKLITHTKINYVKSFAFIYDIFKNNFMKEQTTKKLEKK